MSDDGIQRASDVGSSDAPPVEEKPYKIIFEANKCFGAGKCAEVSDNWEMSLASGLAKPTAYFFSEQDLEHNVRAAAVCPAKRRRLYPRRRPPNGRGDRPGPLR